jgi:hypothetical protein
VGATLSAEQYQIIKDAYRAEGVPLENAHITVNCFCHITDSKEDPAPERKSRRDKTAIATQPVACPHRVVSRPGAAHFAIRKRPSDCPVAAYPRRGG